MLASNPTFFELYFEKTYLQNYLDPTNKILNQTNQQDLDLLYILTSVWVLGTPYAGRNGHFQGFLCKKTYNICIFAKTFSIVLC